MKKDSVKSNMVSQNGPTGFVLFIAWIGAAVYFVQQSAGFWGFCVAILRACVWPAYVLYHVLKLFHA